MSGKVIGLIFTIVFLTAVIVLLSATGGSTEMTTALSKISEVFVLAKGQIQVFVDALPFVQSVIIVFSTVLVIEGIILILRVLNFIYNKKNN